MIDLDTFLTTRYVMIDDFCQSELEPEKPKPGRQASRGRSEVMALALFGQWVQFPSERAFDRDAEHHLRGAFPPLPNRSQFNRLQRSARDEITTFARCVVQGLQARDTVYELLESTAAVTRDATRRGLGWLVRRISAGVIALAGRKAFICC
jgi:hypothetical protein